jgi:hypothetical protein
VLIALQEIKEAIKIVFEEGISFDRHLLLLAIRAKEQKSKRAKEQKSKRAKEQKSKRAKEQRASSDFNASRED